MYAIMQIGTRQYIATEGQKINIDRVDKEPGDSIIFDNILLIKNKDKTTIGNPLIAGAQVKATIDEHTRDKKVIAYRYKNKTRSGTKKGHRQHKTVITINKITTSAKKKSK
ncbi:MAG: 50S ribosomal protein L21 [Dehalococcoidaceae bacterium]|nr:50S ribosomal protein L21 [Dehalococcoidaceae bacterium]|tara:strand:+ start:26902 stop:27234 length:333 start_codon:yes stop_codon:yes gene_type:complete